MPPCADQSSIVVPNTEGTITHGSNRSASPIHLFLSNQGLITDDPAVYN